MATWKPLPSVPVQAYGALTPVTGKFNSGARVPSQQGGPPTKPWTAAYPNSSVGSDGTDVFTTG